MGLLILIISGVFAYMTFGLKITLILYGFSIGVWVCIHGALKNFDRYLADDSRYNRYTREETERLNEKIEKLEREIDKLKWDR